MDEKKLVHKPHVGPEPVEAKPNHDREKTYTEPGAPKNVKNEHQKMPEKTAEAKVEEDMSKAVQNVKKRL